jgi:hypothetical protein
MDAKRLLTACLVVVAMAGLLVANAEKDPPSGIAMIKASQTFLNALSELQRAKAKFEYDDKERLNWHFIPRPRKGLPLKELEGDALKSALGLIASGLSTVGYDQALNVMSLEEVLFLIEGGDRDTRRNRRDPQKYYLSVFGEPSEQGTWGWRVEGHHLSLNYSITDGEVVSSTPEFFGANPGVIDSGPGRSIRVLGTEEDIAREILKLCTPEQERIAWIDKEAPADLRGGGVAQPDTAAPVGISVAEMSDDQTRLMGKLLKEYLQNMPADVENRRTREIDEAGLENIRFAWWGGPDLNEPHYYRVQGPTFLIEYNNTQNSANHVHSIWRSLDGDFNVPLQSESPNGE